MKKMIMKKTKKMEKMKKNGKNELNLGQIYLCVNKYIDIVYVSAVKCVHGYLYICIYIY
jgi:hypothetical protein